MKDNEDQKETISTGTKQRQVIPIGKIVLPITKDEEPRVNAEGILLGYAPDGTARVLWYKSLHMSLHWHPDLLRLKKTQSISSDITGDFRKFITGLQYKIWAGLVMA